MKRNKTFITNSIVGDETINEKSFYKSRRFIGIIMLPVVLAVVGGAAIFIAIKGGYLSSYLEDNKFIEEPKEKGWREEKEKEIDTKISEMTTQNKLLIKEKKELKDKVTSLSNELDEIRLRKAKLDMLIKKSGNKEKIIKEKTISVMKHGMEAEKARILRKLKVLEEKSQQLEDKLGNSRDALSVREKELEESKKKIVGLEKALEKSSEKKLNAVEEEKLSKSTAQLEQLHNDRGLLLDDLEEELKKEKVIRHYNVAALLSDLGKYEDAILQYKKVIEMKPDLAEAHYNLGVIYDSHVNKKNLAKIHFGKYIELQPYAQDADKVRQWIREIGDDGDKK